MPELPPDFGGIVGGWAEDGSRAFLMRYGHGELQSAMRLTPINLLAAAQTISALLAEGRAAGHVTDEHLRLADQFPTRPLADVPPREVVDDILGPD